MAANKKPKKKYSSKLRRISPDPVNWVLSARWKVNSIPSTKKKILKVYAAIDNVMEGRGTRQDADTLLNSMWMCRVLMETTGYGIEYKDAICLGEASARILLARWMDTGRFVFAGPELVAIRNSMAVHEAQLDMCVVADIETADAVLHKEYAELVASAQKEMKNDLQAPQP